MAPLPSARRLDQLPVTALKGVGASFAEKLARIGIGSVQDLVFHLPIRYSDRTRILPIGSLTPGAHVVVEGTVKACDVVFGKRRSLVCKIHDATGTLTLRFYHFNAAQKSRLSPGALVRVFGETRRGSAGLEIYHPEYDVIEAGQWLPLDDRLTPIYPATEGLTQGRLRSLAEQAVALLDQHYLDELLPGTANPTHISLADALRYLHHPPVGADLAQLARGEHPAQQRLAFEELLAHHLSLLLLRMELQSDGAPELVLPASLAEGFLHQLGFTMTRAQQRVIAEILEDVATPVPMLRLVQGDVGSGKTAVAAMAALAAVASGYQVAIMAPTEILAGQHMRNFSRWFEPLSIRIGWLTGKLKLSDRRIQQAAIADGTAQVVIGTHALFQDAVEFARLGLVIIDEQHRFGVQQRLTLSEKGAQSHSSQQGQRRPHQLIMTATPIPRTLTMSAYADLDCSVIDELPPGRTPITTVVISDQRRPEVIERVRLACQQGRQAYWVCTLIEESDVLAAQAAEATTESLKVVLPELRIGLIHGKLKPAEKEAAMAAFKAGEIDLLVATTVIEVGVDVPNASLMIIENPERLGLAQLHQLRGRVGRGSAASHCVLLYGSPLSQNGRERLGVMRESNDGFFIAEQDLLLRGPGEVLGTRQTGQLQFRIADLGRDAHLLPAVKEAALQMVANDASRCNALLIRWLGQNQRYLNV